MGGQHQLSKRFVREIIGANDTTVNPHLSELHLSINSLSKQNSQNYNYSEYLDI